MKIRFFQKIGSSYLILWLPGWDDVRTCFMEIEDPLAFRIATNW